MKIFGVLFTLLFFLGGCSSDKQMVVAQKKEIPSWYVEIPQNEDKYIYGTGDGKNKEEAVANALSFMVSTLSVSIASEFEAETIVREGQNSSNQSTYINNVRSDVKKIRISNYELMEMEEVGYKKVVVLVRSDRKKLFESMRSEIEQNFTLAEKKKNVLAYANAIKKLAFYKQTQETFANLPDTLLVMQALDKSFDPDGYLSMLHELDKEYEALQKSITFSVQSNDDGTRLIPSIAKALSDKKLTLDEKENPDHFRVIITSNTEEAFAYGFTLARSAIEINIKDADGTIIASNKLNITGQSTQGYEIAKENVAIKLGDFIQKEGIEKVIGLSI
ncbi:MAG: LPP20 family lipoprotein [Sulfurimonas sp.]|nr:LPP20 family lipoprotein [Sulfurimonas sp.]